jgi:hypothetical protein
LCSSLGRSDFDNIDNEALDFEQLEAFIQNNSSVVQSPTSSVTNANQTNQNEPQTQQINNPTNLPESPPDSGSEPPYSPNVKNLQLEHMTHSTLNTLTELHVPHHHNMMTPSSELFMSNEHSQFGNLMQQHSTNKHETQLLHPPSASDAMMLYQVNQSGQIIELNHIHHQNQQQMNGRLLELDAPTLHEIHPTTLNDNLQIIGEGFTQIGNHGGTVGASGSVSSKKRRNFDGETKVKGYGKSSETSKYFIFLHYPHFTLMINEFYLL